MKIRLLSVLAILLLASGQMPAFAADESFDIARFRVEGNTLLPVADVEQLVSPFVGHHRTYADIQKALEALEGAYRRRGFGTVQVYVPEQELTNGEVQIQVTESAIGRVVLSGNRYFDADNIRRSLPLLAEGRSPNMRQISENVQLANENPAKQLDVTLGAGAREDTVDARVQVNDENPRKVILSLDNTGDADKTGQHRLGVAYRDANLLGNDEVFTLGYITSPDAPGGVNLDVYSIGFRKPFYELGDSLDVILGWSSVNMAANVIAPGGSLALNGKGDVIALRWNHLFPRQGEYSSRLIFGFDQKNNLNPCKTGGMTLVGAGCVSTLERVVSTTYSGQLQSIGLSADYSLGAFYNLGWGDRQDAWRYVYAAGNRAAEKNFLIFQASGSVSYGLDWGGMVRGAITSQYSADPLPATEQLNLTGYAAVRGFNERSVTADQGFVANLELYSADLAPRLGEYLPGSLRALAFYDFAAGYNVLTASSTYTNDLGLQASANGNPNERIALSSLGVGLRYALDKRVSARFDWARIQHSVSASPTTAGVVDSGWRAHFGLSYTF